MSVAVHLAGEPVDDEGASGCLRGGRANSLGNSHRQARGQERRGLIDVDEQTERHRMVRPASSRQVESRHAEPRRQPAHHRERQQLGERVAAEDSAGGGVAQTAKMRLVRIDWCRDLDATAGKKAAGRETGQQTPLGPAEGGWTSRGLARSGRRLIGAGGRPHGTGGWFIRGGVGFVRGE